MRWTICASHFLCFFFGFLNPSFSIVTCLTLTLHYVVALTDTQILLPRSCFTRVKHKIFSSKISLVNLFPINWKTLEFFSPVCVPLSFLQDCKITCLFTIYFWASFDKFSTEQTILCLPACWPWVFSFVHHGFIRFSNIIHVKTYFLQVLL